MSIHENLGAGATPQSEQEGRQTSPTQDAERIGGEKPRVHESDLFPPAAGPRYFGTGAYEMGGSHAEGSDAVGDLNPLGGYGTFSDAGGPGSTTLYGAELPPVSGAPPGSPQGPGKSTPQD